MKKTMIITGVSQGIGYTLARHFSGTYQVIGLDVEKDPELENVAFMKMDLANPEQIDQVFHRIREQFGEAHVLVNNGGISYLEKSILEIDVETFKHLIDVNLVGTFACSKAFLELNDTADYGRIINIASTRAIQNEPNWEAYGASKGGIVALTHSMAVSLSNRNVTVNAISPGWIETSEEPLRDIDHRQHPSGRVGEPMDVARAVAYLVEPSNDFINGHNLVLDGGMTKKMIYEP